jgi:hypothetical protein
MPKTMAPGTIRVGAGEFVANAVPDVFDERDLEYRPRLEPLAPAVDRRLGDRHVSLQQGNSCTGHAVAAMINAVLRNHAEATRPPDGDAPGAGGTKPVRVSPAMLYAMARRYDEFEGEEDAGSSLRGALKGWFYHGVLLEEDWPDGARVEVDLDPVLAAKAMRHPLGAFYRVNPFRLDDMQSAISELYGIAASSVIHEGWEHPKEVVRGGEHLTVIERAPGAALLGGHAYAIVGYNEVGFLVRNSWGSDWGRMGFATLPYDDWLQSAYDAWVARPGVHSVVSSRERMKLVGDTRGGLATGPGPDLVRLQRHVVNLGNEGRLSTSGRFRSTPRQVDLVFSRMQEYHERWAATDAEPGPRRVVLYAHGGLNDEGTGLTIAQKHLNWWLNNRVYPVTFAWQSGPVESLLAHLADTVKLPFGGLGIDLVEQFDRLVERLARSHARWMWDEMKENARAASGPPGRRIVWPEDGADPAPALASVPGATLTVDRLAAYVAAAPKGSVEVHLVGHSAGAIFLAAMLPRLVAAEVPVASLSFLAPAISVDSFAAEVLPHLSARSGPRFVAFGLSDRRELDDVCEFAGKAIYQKSLLYLVSRALERPGAPQRSGARRPKDVAEVPLVGMERFQDQELPGGTTLRQALRKVRGELVWAPTGQPPGSRTDADSHGDFDDDAPTMTSVMTRILGHPEEPMERMVYAPDTSLLDPADALDVPPPDAGETAEVRDAGAVPVTRTAAPQPADVDVPEVRQGRLPEEKVAPRSSSGVMDALLRDGWQEKPRPRSRKRRSR